MENKAIIEEFVKKNKGKYKELLSTKGWGIYEEKYLVHKNGKLVYDLERESILKLTLSHGACKTARINGKAIPMTRIVWKTFNGEITRGKNIFILDKKLGPALHNLSLKLGEIKKLSSKELHERIEESRKRELIRKEMEGDE